MNYEQTVNSIETRQEQFVIKSNIYSVIDKAITLNYNLWTIVYYIVKIGAFLGAILGIFFIPFWVYYFIKKEFGK